MAALLGKGITIRKRAGGRGARDAIASYQTRGIPYAAATRRATPGLGATILADDYLRYMESVFVFIEASPRPARARSLVLLLHFNTPQRRPLPALAAMMKARGYRFVTLEEAAEQAYRRPDTYVGPWGIVAASLGSHGRAQALSPDPPACVMKVYEAATR
jgi:hypothetical protein